MTTVVQELEKVGIPTELGDRIMEECFETPKRMPWAQWLRLMPFDDLEAMVEIKNDLRIYKEENPEMMTPAQYETVCFFFTGDPHACKTSLVMATTQIRASVNPYFV